MTPLLMPCLGILNRLFRLHRALWSLALSLGRTQPTISLTPMSTRRSLSEPVILSLWVLSGPRDSCLKKKMIIKSWGYISGVGYVWHRQGAGYDTPQRRENGEKGRKGVQAQADIICCAASLRPTWDKWDPCLNYPLPQNDISFPLPFLRS